jgi:protoheme IX farnesyltransferase
MALKGYRRDINLQSWARQVFGFSIVIITALSVTMALDFQVVAQPARLILVP